MWSVNENILYEEFGIYFRNLVGHVEHVCCSYQHLAGKQVFFLAASTTTILSSIYCWSLSRSTTILSFPAKPTSTMPAYNGAIDWPRPPLIIMLNKKIRNVAATVLCVDVEAVFILSVGFHDQLVGWLVSQIGYLLFAHNCYCRCCRLRESHQLGKEEAPTASRLPLQPDWTFRNF